MAQTKKGMDAWLPDTDSTFMGTDRSVEPERFKEKHNRTRYNMAKCRCEVCTQANRDYAREWSRKKRGTFPGYKKPVDRKSIEK